MSLLVEEGAAPVVEEGAAPVVGEDGALVVGNSKAAGSAGLVAGVGMLMEVEGGTCRR